MANIGTKAQLLSSKTQACKHWDDLVNKLRPDEMRKFIQKKNLDGKTRVICDDCSETFPDDHNKIHHLRSQLWCCLYCYHIHCSRYQPMRHALEHYKNNKTHLFSINLYSALIWCYECEIQIEDSNDENTSIKPQDFRAIFSQLTRNGLALYDKFLPIDQRPTIPPVKDLFFNPNGGMTGLINVGNSCYFNSTIQALAHSGPFIYTFMDSLALIRDSDDKSPLRIHLVQSFDRLLEKFWSGQYEVCAPTELYGDICRIEPYFRGWAMHDSHELLRCLIDALHEGLKRFQPFPIKKDNNNCRCNNQMSVSNLEKSIDSINDGGGNNDETSNESYIERAKKRREQAKLRPFRSAVGDCLAGETQSDVICSECGTVSTTTEPMMDLSIEIPNKKQISTLRQQKKLDSETSNTRNMLGYITSFIGLSPPSFTIESCLMSFFIQELLVKQDQVFCDKCKKRVNATKQLTISRLPECLVIQIKRFSFGHYYSSKLANHIKFPLRDLDMTPYLTKKNKKSSNEDSVYPQSHSLYDLCAIVKHAGGAGSGHYLTYARHHVTNKWYEFNDCKVTEVSESQVSDKQAYLLFYQKQKSKQKIHQEFVKKQLESTLDDTTTNNVYISNTWINQVSYFSEPTPIDNSTLCCAHTHSLLPQEVESRAKIISKKGWDALVNRYSGGPLIPYIYPSDYEPCEACVSTKKDQERIWLDSAQSMASKLESGSIPCVIIHKDWFKIWRDFVTSTDHKTPPPPPIDNFPLIDSDSDNTTSLTTNTSDYFPTSISTSCITRPSSPGPLRYSLPQPPKNPSSTTESSLESHQNRPDSTHTKYTLKSGLIYDNDYVLLNLRVWQLVHSVYGGGPRILRSTKRSNANDDKKEIPTKI